MHRSAMASNVFYNIDTQANSTTTPPMECRVIVFRAKRANNPAGVSFDPSTSLFLNDIGTPIGHSVSGVNGYDLTRRLLNRRDWIIKRDHRFTLSAPYNTSPQGEVNGYSGKYPCMKNYRATTTRTSRRTARITGAWFCTCARSARTLRRRGHSKSTSVATRSFWIRRAGANLLYPKNPKNPVTLYKRRISSVTGRTPA